MPSPTDAAGRSQVLAAAQSLYTAMIRKDFATLEQIMSPDLVYVHSTAVAESKAEYLAGVANGLYEYESIASRDVDTAIHGNVAIMNGTVDMSVGAAGEPKGLIRLLFVLVWLKRAGAWQLAYRQATRQPGTP
jgi:ketosteroid isomerase-like protein